MNKQLRCPINGQLLLDIEENKMEVKIKKVHKNAAIPKQATIGSAGFDLHVVDAYTYNDNGSFDYINLKPNESVQLDTGLSFQLPEGHVMLITPRSSMGIRKNLMLQNTIGVLDSDYTGHCYLFVKNIGTDVETITNGERIAQAIILPYPKVNFVEVEELDDTERGSGGIGSTGTT